MWSSREMFRDCTNALKLTRAFAGDGYAAHYFYPGLLGFAARLCLFKDDLNLRRRTGLVVDECRGLALVGMPPRLYIRRTDLSFCTNLLLSVQGGSYRMRWRALWDGATPEPESTAYLSAFAVWPKFQSQGYGTRMLKGIVESTFANGFDLECEVSSLSLVRWYSARGFRLIRERRVSDTFSVYDLRASRPSSTGV